MGLGGVASPQFGGCRPNKRETEVPKQADNGALSAKKMQQDDREWTMGCVSRWTLMYLTPLVTLAAKKKRLEVEDTWRSGASES